VTDGTDVGTVALSTAAAGLCAPLVVGSIAFLCNVDEAGDELWTTDGTPAGTARWADLNPGPEGSFPKNLAAAGDKLVFAAQAGTTPALYMASLGTAAPAASAAPDPGAPAPASPVPGPAPSAKSPVLEPSPPESGGCSMHATGRGAGGALVLAAVVALAAGRRARARASANRPRRQASSGFRSSAQTSHDAAPNERTGDLFRARRRR
jgi:ELWxxDGT repeat protein